MSNTDSIPQNNPTPEASQSVKRPNAGRFNRNKRFKFHKSAASTSHSTPITYQQISLPPSIVTQPIQRYFTIHTGNRHLHTFVQKVYDTAVARDFRLSRTVRVSDMQYAASLAFIYRIIYIGVKEGIRHPIGSISLLKQTAEALLLPDLVAKAIESIGSVHHENGATYVPYLPTDEEMFEHEDFVHPCEIPARNIPNEDGVEFEVFPLNFQSYMRGAIDTSRTVSYNNGTTRGFRNGFQFRRVNYDSPEGRIEYLVAREGQPDMCVGRTVSQIDNALAHMGAIYGFRSIESRRTWLGSDNRYLQFTCQSTPVNVDTYTSNVVITSLLPGHGYA